MKHPSVSVSLCVGFWFLLSGSACSDAGKVTGSEPTESDSGTGGSGGQNTGGSGGQNTGGTSATGGSSNGGAAGAEPPSLLIDSVNLSLNGPFGAFPTERMKAAPAAIAGLPSDVVCVQEAWGPEVQSSIVSAAASTFPYRAQFHFDLDTVVDDPSDQSGQVPAPFTEAPCAQSGTELVNVADCVQEHCVSPLGNPMGKPTSQIADCLSSKCLGELLPLVGGTEEAKACYACAFNQLASFGSPEQMRAACLDNPKARYAWNGDSGTFLLSKYPIGEAEAWVLPSTDLRVVVLRAPVLLPSGESLDVYCTRLSEPVDGIARPYTGQYGAGKQGLEAWQQELYLQADKLVKYVQSRSAASGSRGVLASTLYSGPEYANGSTKVLDAINPVAFQTVSNAFPLAVPSAFVPSCTWCANNPIMSPPGGTSGGSSHWESFVFLVKTPASDIVSAEVFLKDATIPVTANGSAFSIPVSPLYGFRSRVRLNSTP